MRANKTTINLQSDDIPLNHDGACFSVINCGIPITTNDPEKLLKFDAAVAVLPTELLSQFRTVVIQKPALQLQMEVMLVSQGFHKAQDLARKIRMLCEMSKNLIGVDAAVTNSTEHLSKSLLKIDGLVQERRNSSALAMELHLSCVRLSEWLWARPL